MVSIVNLDLLSVGIASAGIIILGFAVYYNNRNSLTNKTFIFFAFSAVLWSVFNYLYNQPAQPTHILWLLRIHAFFAVWYVYFLFQLFFVFPENTKKFPTWYKFGLLPIISVTSLITLTPLVFESITKLSSEGTILGVMNGSGIYIFGAVVTCTMVAAMAMLLRKSVNAKGSERKPFDFVLFGATITFCCHIVFNFILPAFFDNPTFVPFGAVFIFPFVALTSYAVIRHHLLNMKVIATEILTFVLAIATFFEIILSQNLALLIFRTAVFILILSIGVVLNRSVRKEVEQREKLEILDKELEAANEQLKQLDKARAEFISIASHQLRTPPATIKWYLAAVLGGDFGEVNDRARKAIQTAEMTNNSQISLIDDMLNASRIERGKMEFYFEPTDLLKITQITVDQLTPQAIQRKQKLVFATPKIELPQINADKEKLRQVINNIIDNAIKYTPTGGTITVSLEKTAKDVFVKVTDTGRGIKKEELDHIFTKYDRGGRKMDSQGLGLGMYVAKVIIGQHQGKIWAESPGENKGSTFVIQLPIKTDLKNSTFDLAKQKT